MPYHSFSEYPSLEAERAMFVEEKVWHMFGSPSLCRIVRVLQGWTCLDCYPHGLLPHPGDSLHLVT